MTVLEHPEEKKVLLIDLDNCPAAEVAQLPANLAFFKRIVGCSGPQEPRIPLSLATALATPLHQGTLELIKMRRGGKNAADFGLAFLAGRLLAEMPEDTSFVVLSKDRDLDHVIDLLHAAGREAERIAPGTKIEQSNFEPISDDSAIDQLAHAFWLERLEGKVCRPATEKTLLKAIVDFAKPISHDDAKQVMQCLAQWQVLSVSPNGKKRVNYSGKQTLPFLEDNSDLDDIPF